MEGKYEKKDYIYNYYTVCIKCDISKKTIKQIFTRKEKINNQEFGVVIEIEGKFKNNRLIEFSVYKAETL